VTGHQVVNDVLVIDCGEGRQAGPGSIRYTRQPAARFKCYRCRTATDPVTGAEAVKAFVRTIRADHRATCPGLPNTQGATA